MVSQGSRARENVSVLLKKVALRQEKSQASFFSSRELSFSSTWTVYPCFARLDNCPISEKETSLSEKKLRLRFFLSQRNECVDRVKSYKYLGVTIDDQLDWHEHLPNVYKKVNSRLYFLRKLKSFRVDNTLIKLFYQATIESITSFCLICWGGNSRKNEINKINRVITKSEKICANSFLHVE